MFCAPGSYDADEGPGLECKKWTDCAPGSYIFGPGTSVADRACQYCGAGWFTSEPNSSNCSFGGCEVGELVTEPGDNIRPSTCEKDPNTHVLSSTSAYDLNLKDLTASATTAHLGMVGRETTETLTIIDFQGTVVSAPTNLSFATYPEPRSFEVAVDGTMLFTLWDGEDAESAMQARSPLGDALWSEVAADTGTWVPYRVLQYASLHVTDSHVISWSEPETINSSSRVQLRERELSGASPLLSQVDLPVQYLSGFAVDDGEGLWAYGYENDSYVRMMRLDSIDSEPEVELVEVEETSQVIAAAPDGRGYLAFVGPDRLAVQEFDVALNKTRYWEVFLPSVGFRYATNMAITASDEIIIAGNFHTPATGSGLFYTAQNGFVVKLDMSDGTHLLREYQGQYSDEIFDLVVTRDGQAYILGETASVEDGYSRNRLFVSRAF
jgi:hypothetical protein